MNKLEPDLTKGCLHLLSLILRVFLFVIAPLAANEQSERLVSWNVDVEIIIIANELLLCDALDRVSIHEAQELSLERILSLRSFLELLELKGIEPLV